MRYAQIKDNIVKNIIVLEDVSLIPIFSDGFDYFFEVGETPEDAKIGDLYDPQSGTFTKAPLTPEQLAYKQMLEQLKANQDAEFEAFKAWKASQP